MDLNIKIPKMMTIRQIAKTGLLPENALRVMVKNGEIPAVYSGTKAFINFDNLCHKLEKLGYCGEGGNDEKRSSQSSSGNSQTG